MKLTMKEDSRVLYYWGPLLQCKPVISSSSKYLLAALESTIKVFNTTSGSLITTLKGHQDEIVGLTSLDGFEDHFISCDTVGRLCYWNLAQNIKGSPLKRVCYLPTPYQPYQQTRVVSCLSRGTLNEMIIGVLEEGKSSGQLLFFDSPLSGILPFHDETLQHNHLNLAHKESSVDVGHGLASISLRANFMAFITNSKRLQVLNLGNMDRIKHKIGNLEITCIACHPSMLSVATGDCIGKILIWYNIFDNCPVKNELHWHSLPVSDLAFSSTGAELYSGGRESVLVKWQLTERKHYFLPRLGMPIYYVITDMKNNKIVCAHVDSAFSVLSAKEYKLEGLIQGVSLTSDNSNPYPAGFTYDPRTKGVILNGKSGHLQFYDLHHNKLLYLLDIVRSNLICESNDQKVYNPEVEKVAISPDGSWLATVEYRDDFETSREVRLKVWYFDKEKQSWFLNTGMEMPHDKYINGLTFDPAAESPSTSMLVSCSDDGKFKVWEVVDSSDIYKQSNFWRCRKVGFYRHLPATAVTVAPDGSLIAAGFANVLTIWTADQCHLKGTLSQQYLKENIRQIEFGRTESCGSMIVSCSENWLCGWNLFTCTLSWRVMINATCMAVDPMSSYMVVFSKTCDAYIFEPQNTLVFTRLEKILTRPAICATFLPREVKCESSLSWNEESQLFIIDEAQRLKLIEPKGDMHAAEAAIEGVVEKLVQDIATIPAATPFTALVAKTRASDVKEEKSGQTGSASYGVRVQNAYAFLQKVLDETRVYRLEAFADLAQVFCKLVIPESNTSEEQDEQRDLHVRMKEQGIIRDKGPEDYKWKKKIYKRLIRHKGRDMNRKKQEEMEKKAKDLEKKEKKMKLGRSLASDFGDLLDILKS